MLLLDSDLDYRKDSLCPHMTGSPSSSLVGLGFTVCALKYLLLGSEMCEGDENYILGFKVLQINIKKPSPCGEGFLC